jgi:hypothetical protein
MVFSVTKEVVALINAVMAVLTAADERDRGGGEGGGETGRERDEMGRNEWGEKGEGSTVTTATHALT